MSATDLSSLVSRADVCAVAVADAFRSAHRGESCPSL